MGVTADIAIAVEAAEARFSAPKIGHGGLVVEIRGGGVRFGGACFAGFAGVLCLVCSRVVCGSDCGGKVALSLASCLRFPALVRGTMEMLEVSEWMLFSNSQAKMRMHGGWSFASRHSQCSLPLARLDIRNSSSLTRSVYKPSEACYLASHEPDMS